MAISREKKGTILKSFKDIFDKISSGVFVTFHGLTVKEVTDLRRELKKEGVAYKVAKKTILNKALGEAPYTGTAPELPGEIALVYATDANAEDITAPARGVFAYEGKLDGRVAIVGGIFEGAFLDKEGMLQIATIPSIQTLRGMFVNVINSPIQGLVVALGQIAGKKE